MSNLVLGFILVPRLLKEPFLHIFGYGRFGIGPLLDPFPYKVLLEDL